MEKINRAPRNRKKRHSRRLGVTDNDDDLLYNQQPKRLFTPEIKRLLKEWLIRRRENPYPNRDEKKCLALKTGLTYTQICNWFANWRRKLKNSEEKNMTRKTNSWGHLIKNYNTNVKGKVEQFSISSEDSIWKEENDQQFYCGSNSCCNNNQEFNHDHTFGISFTPNNIDQRPHHKHYNNNGRGIVREDRLTKYKQKSMEKYVTDTQTPIKDFHIFEQKPSPATTHSAHFKESLEFGEAYLKHSKTESTKWLESAYTFTPKKYNYFIDNSNKKSKTNCKLNYVTATTMTTESFSSLSSPLVNNRGQLKNQNQDELEAAEALTNLALNCRQKRLNVVTEM